MADSELMNTLEALLDNGGDGSPGIFLLCNMGVGWDSQNLSRNFVRAIDSICSSKLTLGTTGGI